MLIDLKALNKQMTDDNLTFNLKNNSKRYKY